MVGLFEQLHPLTYVYGACEQLRMVEFVHPLTSCITVVLDGAISMMLERGGLGRFHGASAAAGVEGSDE